MYAPAWGVSDMNAMKNQSPTSLTECSLDLATASWMSPPNTTIRQRPSDCKACNNCIALASLNLTTCALGNRSPTTKPFNSSPLGDVIKLGPYLVPSPAVYLPALTNCSVKYSAEILFSWRYCDEN